MQTPAHSGPSWSLLVVLSLLFLLSYGAARALLELVAAPPLRVASALLPIPFFALWLLTIIRGIRELDELERRIQLEAVAFAFLLTLILLLTLSLLEIAVTLPPEDLSYRHVWPFLPIFYFLGVTIARRRYQ
ncbi:MAG TPA: hypothetical protein VF707_17725 [Ardenticatenaceae bacterium]